jgi:hypothetical protein
LSYVGLGFTRDELQDLFSTINQPHVENNSNTIFDILDNGQVSEDFIVTSIDSLDNILNGKFL